MSATSHERERVLDDCAVGDAIPPLEREIDLPTLVRYAGASGDFNPIHYDPRFAKAAGLDGVIGHGAFAMALVSSAVTGWVGDSGLLRRLSLRFASPYRLGDVLIVTGTVTDRRVDGDGVVSVDLDLRCVNQEGTEVVRNATATLQSR